MFKLLVKANQRIFVTKVVNVGIVVFSNSFGNQYLDGTALATPRSTLNAEFLPSIFLESSTKIQSALCDNTLDFRGKFYVTVVASLVTERNYATFNERGRRITRKLELCC
jgi:hypothetical protein